MEKIRIGVIGIGSMGSSHVIQLDEGKVPNAEMTAVCDIDPARLEAAKKLMPSLKTFDTAEALIDSGEVDAVIICTPHYSHPELVVKALEKGIEFGQQAK